MQRIIRNLWVIVFLMPALLLAGLTKEPYQEGKHYRLLKEPVQTSVSPDNIEVAEVFWYGCPHCYSLETEVNRWKPSMPKEARFIRIPGFFGPNLWKTHAQLYYTLESLLPDKKDFEPVHDAVFQGIQKRTISLASEKEMAEYLSKHHKIDKEKFRKYYQSFGIENLMNQAYSKVHGYRLTGVPALVVDGRFVIEPKVGLENMTKVTDFLIQKVSEERGAKAQDRKSSSIPKNSVKGSGK